MKLPDILIRELESCGLPWHLEEGSRHAKIYVAGRFAGVSQKSSTKDSTAGRGALNVRAQIRRVVRECKECMK